MTSIVHCSDNPKQPQGSPKTTVTVNLTEFSLFPRLPAELRREIIMKAYKGKKRYKGVPRYLYACISKDWQEVVETYVFKKEIRLRPQELGAFERIITGRRTLLIQGVLLTICLEDIDAEFLLGDDAGLKESPVPISAWFPHEASMPNVDILSAGVTDIFSRLFRIINNWPWQRSSEHLLQLRYKVQESTLKPLLQMPESTLGMESLRSMLLCDFQTLDKVAAIGKIVDVRTGPYANANRIALHPFAHLALLQRLPQVHDARLILGTGVGNHWLRTAAGAIQDLSWSAPRLKKLELGLLQNCDLKRGRLIPSNTNPDFQALSVSIFKRMPTMTHLTHLTLNNVVDVLAFFSLIMRRAPTNHDNSAPKWPGLEELHIHGHYKNDDENKKFNDAHDPQKLFQTIGHALGHFPDMRYLNVTIRTAPSPPASITGGYVPQNDQIEGDHVPGKLGVLLFSVSIRQASNVFPAWRREIHKMGPTEAFLAVGGFMPQQCGSEVWAENVRRHWQTELSIWCAFDLPHYPDDFFSLNRVVYNNHGDEEDSEEEDLEEGLRVVVYIYSHLDTDGEYHMELENGLLQWN